MSDSDLDDEDLRQLAYCYALDAVSDAERAAIDARLAAADEHTAREFDTTVRAVREVMAMVTGLGVPAPPPELKKRINAALDEHERRGSSDELGRVRRRHRRVARGAAAAAVVAAICVGSAAANDMFSRPARSGPTVAEVMRAPDTDTAIRGVAGGGVMIATSRHMNAAVVVMAHVAPPPVGHVYQMWLLPSAGAARLVGTMDATRMPPQTGQVLTDLDSATMMTMTVESGTGSTQPTTPPIVSIPLAE